MQAGNANKIAVYSRKSKFTGKGESIENQIELCRQYIRLNVGMDAAEKALVYEDEGFSGGNMERPQFKKMMADAEKGKFAAVVVYRLDRISRNIGDFAKLIERLNELNVSFVSIKEQFDTSSPMGRAMMYIASVFSQLERETIAERIRDNMYELAKTGRWLGGVTPTGYASENVESFTIDGKVKKACKLKLVADEAELVRQIFRLFLEKGSLTKTETYLYQNGCKSKNGKAFSRFTIKGILSNPVYMVADQTAYAYFIEHGASIYAPEARFDGQYGVMPYNRTVQKSGKAHKMRDMSEWVIAVGKHTGIIESEDWIEAQKRLEENRTKGYRRPRGSTALLSGVLLCKNCGAFMRPKLSGRCRANGERIYSYLCSVKEKSRLQCCSVSNADGGLIDKAVLHEITSLAYDAEEFQYQLKQQGKRILESRMREEKEADKIDRAIGENEREIKGLVSALGSTSGIAAEKYIVEEIEELHRKNEVYKKQREALVREKKMARLDETALKTEKQKLLSFSAITGEIDAEGKRRMIKLCVDKVLWDGETADVYLHGTATGPSGEDSK